MCIYCFTYIQLNDYWINMYGLDINKKYYISINNWSQLLLQSSFTLQNMINLIKDLNLEKEVSLNIDICNSENIWIIMSLYFDYCLENFKKGQLDIIKSVGKIMPTEIMDKIIDSCRNNKSIHDENISIKPIEKINDTKSNCKSINIKFISCIQSAYETE